MKKLISLIALLVSTESYAGSLDCKISKGTNNNKISLVQTVFAKDDPEEESETYELSYDKGSVKAKVIYFPYQNGVDLILEATKEEFVAQTNFDMKIDGYMNLDIKVKNINYRLECLR